MSIAKTFRLWQVSASLFRQVLNSFYNVMIPFLAIYFAGKSVWGEFVSLYLYLFLATFIITWGNRTFLLRQFSEQPRNIVQDFSESLATRGVILLGFLALNFLFFELEQAFWIGVCLVGFYLSTSFDVFVIYEKEFDRSLLYDTISFVFLLLLFYVFGRTNQRNSVLLIFSLYQFIRGLFYVWRYYRYCDFRQFNFRWQQLSRSWVFALMTLLGFWGYKMDVFLVERLTDPVTTADYQIINALLVFLMSVSTLVLTPFTKNMYRGSAQFIGVAHRWMLMLGVVVPLVALPLIGLVLFFWLELSLGFWFYVLAFAYIYPSYLNSVEVMLCFRRKQDKKVLLIALIALLTNFGLSAWLLMAGWGIEGALAGGVVAQWVAVICYQSTRSPKQEGEKLQVEPSETFIA